MDSTPRSLAARHSFNCAKGWETLLYRWGFAIDLTFGGVSRPHEDVDLYPLGEDTPWWKDWFRSQGYRISKDTDMGSLPNAFSLINENNGYLADVYPIAIGSNGEISIKHLHDFHRAGIEPKV